MNTTNEQKFVCCFLVILLAAMLTGVSLIAGSGTGQEHPTYDNDSTKKDELRYYFNYGYKAINPSAINLELSKAGYSGLPSGLIEFSFGYKRFSESNWMYGFDVGVGFGGTSNSEFSTGSFNILERLWGGYRFINTESVKIYGATGLEIGGTFTTITKFQSTSFSNYLANPIDNSPRLQFNSFSFGVPVMLNAEIKLPRIFQEKSDTWLGVYAGYVFNLSENAPVRCANGVLLTNAPNQPGGGFMAGISLSFDWAQVWRENIGLLAGEKK